MPEKKCCKICPIFERGNWCKVRAEWRSAFAPACTYGAVLIAKENGESAADVPRPRRGVTGRVVR